MPAARLSLQSLSRQCRAVAPQIRAPFSTTPQTAALKRDIPQTSSTSSNLLDLDRDPDRPPALSGLKALTGLMHRARVREGMKTRKEDALTRASAAKEREEYTRQLTRKWKAGDVYAPHDLSRQEMTKWKQPRQPTKDILDMVGLSPLDEYKNFSIISEFMTPMGRIKHSQETGLRPVNQRKMAKAIRRAIGLGIHPSTHRHPMLLFRQQAHTPQQRAAATPYSDARRAINVK